jgi:hypothetical protein
VIGRPRSSSVCSPPKSGGDRAKPNRVIKLPRVAITFPTEDKAVRIETTDMGKPLAGLAPLLVDDSKRPSFGKL